MTGPAAVSGEQLRRLQALRLRFRLPGQKERLQYRSAVKPAEASNRGNLLNSWSMRVNSRKILASGEISPSCIAPSFLATVSMQSNKPSRPAIFIWRTREKSTTTCGLAVDILVFSSRPSLRASLPPNTSGNLIMIADCVFMSPSLGSCNAVQKLKIHLFVHHSCFIHRCELLITGLRRVNLSARYL